MDDIMHSTHRILPLKFKPPSMGIRKVPFSIFLDNYTIGCLRQFCLKTLDLVPTSKGGARDSNALTLSLFGLRIEKSVKI
jgi:hypothetical protein